MANTPAARLANLKVRYSMWTIGPSMPVIGKVGYLATHRNSDHEPIHVGTLTELETALEAAPRRLGGGR